MLKSWKKYVNCFGQSRVFFREFVRYVGRHFQNKNPLVMDLLGFVLTNREI